MADSDLQTLFAALALLFVTVGLALTASGQDALLWALMIGSWLAMLLAIRTRWDALGGEETALTRESLRASSVQLRWWGPVFLVSQGLIYFGPRFSPETDMFLVPMGWITLGGLVVAVATGWNRAPGDEHASPLPGDAADEAA